MGNENYVNLRCVYESENGKGGYCTQPWRCTSRSCSATLRTRKSAGQLVGDTLPSHSHTNQLLKHAAKEIEESVMIYKDSNE